MISNACLKIFYVRDCISFLAGSRSGIRRSRLDRGQSEVGRKHPPNWRGSVSHVPWGGHHYQRAFGHHYCG